jgi:hypothetical protein
MNTRWNNFLSVIALSMILILGSCGAGNESAKETSEQVFMKKISGTWNVGVVTYDGVDVTKSFPSMIVSLGEDKTIKVTNPIVPMWKSASTFVLQPSGTTFQLKRNDGLLMSVESPTAQKLVITFLFDASSLTSRATSVVGNFKFEFTK